MSGLSFRIITLPTSLSGARLGLGGEVRIRELTGRSCPCERGRVDNIQDLLAARDGWFRRRTQCRVLTLYAFLLFFFRRRHLRCVEYVSRR